MEFCERIQKESWNIIWTCNGRVDNLDDEMLVEMKKAGCKMIRLGIESGSQEVLDKIAEVKWVSTEALEPYRPAESQ